MNYYNPYFMSYPYLQMTPRIGLFQRLFGNLNFSSILSGTQKTLNIVNQGIPLIKQARPIIKNAKTISDSMRNTILETPFIQKMANDNDVVIRVIRKKPGYFDSAHKNLQYIYNLSFSVLKAGSLLDRVKDFFHLKNRCKLAYNYHSEEGVIKRLNDKTRATKIVNSFQYFI